MPNETSPSTELLHLSQARDGGSSQSSSEELPRSRIAPKTAKSAFTLFFEQYRQEAAEKYPGVKGRALASRTRKDWETCDESLKNKIEAEAKKDLRRYRRQVEEFEREGRYYDEEGNVVNPWRLDGGEERDEAKRKKRGRNTQAQL